MNNKGCMISTRRTICGIQRVRSEYPSFANVSSRQCTRARGNGDYYKLEDCIWQGTEEEALVPGSLPEQLTPPWKVCNGDDDTNPFVVCYPTTFYKDIALFYLDNVAQRWICHTSSPINDRAESEC